MAEDRIAKLSQRFRTHNVGRKPDLQRTRERKSFYLDVGVVQLLDTSYRNTNHTLHPVNVSKSVFLETLIRYGLDHVDEFREDLLRAQEGEPGVQKN